MDTTPADRFHVLARLGSGTTGAVFRATRVSDDRQVALKALHGDFVAVTDVEHLERVCQALAAVQHHAIPANTTLLRWRGDLVVVRGYLQGVDLATVVAGSAPPHKVALHLTSEVAGALAKVLEETGFSHGDVKPSNIFVDRAGDVQIVDFGMARPHPEKADRTLTLFHASVGFMAPERVDHQRDAKSDVYSVGLILAWMFTGEMPRRTSANPTRHAEQRQQLVDRVRANGAPSEAVTAIAECTTYDPSERPEMGELARRLAEIAANTSGPAVRVWAGPLVEALVVQPNEVEITDLGQSLSAATSVPRLPTPGGAQPVSRIRTAPVEPPRPPEEKKPPIAFAIGVGLLMVTVALVAGAISIAFHS